MAASAAEMISVAAQGVAASSRGSGAPLVVNPDKDLAAKPGAEQDSWFVISQLLSDAGPLDICLHYIKIEPPEGDAFVQSILSVFDRSSGRAVAEEIVCSPAEAVFSRDTFDVRTPTGAMHGSATSMRTTGRFGAMAVDLTMGQDGPLLANLGTGLLPFYGDLNYEFALPTMPTTGTVTLDGTTHDVSGTSWFDRQWGRHAASFWTVRKWTWFGISLDDGVRVSLWDIIDAAAGTEHAFATVVHPNGRHEIADARPVADGAGAPWISPSGQTYPTTWDVSIPALDAALRIESRARQQEIPSPVGAHKYEGSSTVRGTLHGRPVTGHAVAELVGNWT